MIIKNPYIEEKNDKIYIIYPYQLEDLSENRLWFELEKEYKKYVTLENSDAGLVTLLLLAMKKGENIEVEGKVSEKLYYNIKNYIINALNLANKEWQKIEIKVRGLNSEKIENSKNVGTGLSCGVDSLSTIYNHEEFEENNFKVNYFTFLNAGSHGEFGGEKARKKFRERYKLVKKYPTKNKIITIDSNMNEILMMNHQLTHTLRSIGCILNLQKLFKYYYYASTYRFENYKLKNSIDTGNYDILLLPLLSTETTTFYSSVSQYTRIERTEIITRYPESYTNLNVCVGYSKSENVENCSICSKCLRTEITLDLLGKLNLYNKIFDLEKYNKIKDKYIGYILYSKKNNIFSNEIYELMLEKKHNIRLISHIYRLLYLGKYSIKNILEKR